jgi:hypothetical protein
VKPSPLPRRRFLAWLLALALAGGLVSCGGSGGGARGDAPDGAAHRDYPVRGVYDRDLSPSGFDDERATGFNLIDSDPDPEELDRLARRRLKGLVWLGGYSNTTCRFNESDAWVAAHVKAVAGHRAVGAYYIDDEPDADRCPRAPAQMKARSKLVKSIDSGPPTLLVSYKPDQFKLFGGAVDVIGLDRYPCTRAGGCDYSRIDAEAAAADRLGVRYWGVIQAYGDDFYKAPTPPELHQEFLHWRRTRMEGYLVFAWRYPKDRPRSWLAHNAPLRRQLIVENRR